MSNKNTSHTLAAALAATAVCLAGLAAVPSEVAAQDGGGVINLEETVIEGRIQKPEAFYILQHASLNYEALDVKPSFIPELLKSAEKEPF